MNYNNYLLLVIFTFLFSDVVYNKNNEDIDAQIICIDTIYNNHSHAAFTDIIMFNNYYYIVFRESNTHVHGENGKVVVLRSTDTKKWDKFYEYSDKEFDIRDPKFCLHTIEKKLYIFFHGRKFQGNKVVGTKNYYLVINEDNQLEFKTYEINSRHTILWPWRYFFNTSDTSFYNLAYNHIYTQKSYEGELVLLKTRNFKKINILKEFSFEHFPSESTIKIENGKYYALIRRKRDHAIWAEADEINGEWVYNSIPIKAFGGPNFEFINDSIVIIGGRGVDENNVRKTQLYSYNLSTREFKFLIELPSYKDNSYPGFYFKSKNELWVSYYSTLEQSSSSIILLAKVKIQY